MKSLVCVSSAAVGFSGSLGRGQGQLPSCSHGMPLAAPAVLNGAAGRGREEKRQRQQKTLQLPQIRCRSWMPLTQGISSVMPRSWWLNIFLMFNSKTLLRGWITKFALKLIIKQRADFNEKICSPLRYWLRQSQTTSLESKKQTIYSSWSLLGTTVKTFCAKWLMK